jgi:nitrogen-specific signal transduction histidine kinase
MNAITQLDIANRLESLVRRADIFGPKDRNEILEEINMIAEDIKKAVDREQEEMARYFGQF